MDETTLKFTENDRCVQIRKRLVVRQMWETARRYRPTTNCQKVQASDRRKRQPRNRLGSITRGVPVEKTSTRYAMIVQPLLAITNTHTVWPTERNVDPGTNHHRTTGTLLDMCVARWVLAAT